MIQLANVTRDIERDLERGVSYHPALKAVSRPDRLRSGNPGRGP